MWREVLELARLACVEPLGLSLRGRLCEARYQGDWSCDGEVALSTHLAQVRDLPVLEAAGIRLRAIEQPRDFWRRDQCVVFGLECGELLAANVGAATRHHHRGVPAQHGHSTAEGMETFPFLFELLVRGLGHDEDAEGGGEGRLQVYQPPSFQPGHAVVIFFLINYLIDHVAIDSAAPGGRENLALCQIGVWSFRPRRARSTLSARSREPRAKRCRPLWPRHLRA